MRRALRMTGRLEPRSSWTADQCTIAGTLDAIGTRSGFLLLREAFYGTTRFGDFAARAGLSEPVTAARLRELVAGGLLEREEYREPGERTRPCYGLTDKGADLFPAFAALMQWGDRWLDDRGGPLELRHHECRARVTVELRCAAGHALTPDELDLAVRRPRRTSASLTDA